MTREFFENKQACFIDAFERVQRGEVSLREAAQRLQITYRHSRRLWKKYQAMGTDAFVHGAKGKASNRATKPEVRQAVLARYQQRYADFGPTLAAEKLSEEGFSIDHETLRLWLLEEGLWQRQRKRARHRSWRERKAHFGEMLQMDGSFHAWFEERGEVCCLMNCVDDATGVTFSLFAEQETTEAAMTLLWKWIDNFGIPRHLYTDRKNVYVVSEEVARLAALEGREEFTQFGKACDKLGIRMIKAYSPQAKGRVERRNGNLQDRLVKELRLAGISDIASANEFLYGYFLEKFNQPFAKLAREDEDYHWSAKGIDLAGVFCLEQEREIAKDWSVRFENQLYQLKSPSCGARAKGKVLVRKRLNGELRFNYQGEDCDYQIQAARVLKEKKKASDGLKREPLTRKYVPSPEHPWRKSWKK
jgi:transposase